jgi:hypothetical protein
MFQYVLGWIAIALVPVVIGLMIFVGVTGDDSGGSIIFKLIWTPIILIWGIKQIRKYQPVSTKNDTNSQPHS